MITYNDIIRYSDIPFGEYLKLNGYSHSFLKSNLMGVKKDIKITDNIRIGAMVDAILTEPSKVDMGSELYPFCKAIAFELKQVFGDLINTCTKQISYTANVCMNNFILPTTGRLDLLLEEFGVIDLKITKAKNIDDLIKYMGYENQLWHYSKMANVDKAYLIFYSIPLKKVVVKSVNVKENYNEFWAEKIINFGTVKAQLP